MLGLVLPTWVQKSSCSLLGRLIKITLAWAGSCTECVCYVILGRVLRTPLHTVYKRGASHPSSGYIVNTPCSTQPPAQEHVNSIGLTIQQTLAAIFLPPSQAKNHLVKEAFVADWDDIIPQTPCHWNEVKPKPSTDFVPNFKTLTDRDRSSHKVGTKFC